MGNIIHLCVSFLTRQILITYSDFTVAADVIAADCTRLSPDTVMTVKLAFSKVSLVLRDIPVCHMTSLSDEISQNIKFQIWSLADLIW